ncbi:hypothetical protein CBR_g45992 [Chara braunii]|uniref:Jacalin-type lectin domain-containing protein n=1 Tax=Chara braunii TaxID=69332 RepID=A0A388LZV9_CHABU|nr:hypothetical protein CBR_g45992 [Chara braunii]|eukprot:GBG87836.1 hypothetical protein CBR_g45992 [Chara braunii]
MAALAPVHLIGGNGGGDFYINGAHKGAILKRIRVWVGGWMIRGIEVQLSDGESQMFGSVDGGAREFTFQIGEKIAWLSLWGNGAGTRLGAIKFGTTHRREFFAKMTDWGLKTEYKMEVGSGICVGLQGKCGADIDCAGFLFIKDGHSLTLR